ncbi:hypothetical protein BKN38_04025 [Helicobacter sp. CLO-3]|uniref:TolC family protein n=1 Tax=unclassified Helicobacter TaxID=2593540 RepID=UPI00080542F6|nr:MULTISPECIES: TolC family protein [unclassified Helicobacter]OBV29576.1 hypothetical protein BA723_04925 [Helicobacter sp. CLO-3]OHU84084.1 hypothetical protein BKN38_04025 [Helicobacter sp. CLO-3]
MRFFALLIFSFCLCLAARPLDSGRAATSTPSADSWDSAEYEGESSEQNPEATQESATMVVNDMLSQIQDLTKNSKNMVGLTELLNGADNNYSLQAALLQVASAKKNTTIAKASFLPRLDIDYAYQYTYRSLQSARSTFGDNVMDFGQMGNYQNQAASARFSLDLFSGFSTLNQIRERSATYRSSIADAEHTKQQIYLQVIQQYYSYFNNLSQLLSLARQLEEVQSDLKRVEQLYRSGLSTIDDMESLRSQVSSSEYQIASMKLSVEENILMLKYLTNLEFDGLRREDIATPALKTDIERADITSLKEQIKSLKYQNKQLNYFPTITLADTYTWNVQKPAYVTATGANPFLVIQFPTHSNVLSITATLKLFDDIGLTLQKQYMKLNQLSQEKQLAYRQAEKTKDEILYRRRLEVARSQILSSEASLKSANISFDNVRKRYNNQLVNFTDYLRALSTKYNAEATYNQALNNYELQKANYIFYSGQTIQEYVKK